MAQIDAHFRKQARPMIGKLHVSANANGVVVGVCEAFGKAYLGGVILEPREMRELFEALKTALEDCEVRRGP